MGTAAGARRLTLAGWALAGLVGVLALLLRGSDELFFTILAGAIALLMILWLRRGWSRAAAITSLVLGVLWLLQFVAYSIAGLLEEDFDVSVFVVDVIGVVAGVAIVLGSVGALRRSTQPAAPI